MRIIQEKRNWVWISLALIVFVGAFFRLYHLFDWVHFELDQARDAKVIVSAIEDGIGNLPLLGPRAGGTFLRLGPGFYYLEYVGALIFGSQPGDLAIPIALFSCASIVLMYVFIRRYFEVSIALGLTAIFSVSSFMVLYGRFAWNPNPLPFFLIGGFYALLRSVDESERYRGRFFVLSAVLLAFATHLHFLAFLTLPVMVAIFLLYKRARFGYRAWCLAIGAIVLMYVPVALNESITGGANTQEFFQAISGKSNKSHHTIVEQIVRNTTNNALGYAVILTGYEESSMGQLVSTGPVTFELLCDDDCHTHFRSALFALVIFVGGAVLLVYRWRTETVTVKKDFLFLTGVWFGLCFIMFTPLAYDFSPRFLLLIAPFPFIFLGLLLEAWHHKASYTTVRLSLLWSIPALFVFFGTVHTISRLDELYRASFENVQTVPDRILKEKARVTLEQQYLVLDYMQSFQSVNAYPIYMFSEPEHRRALKYLMEQRGMQNDVLGFTDNIYKEGNYFLIIRTDSNHANRLKKYLPVYDVIEEKVVGTLTIFHLKPKDAFITAQKQEFLPKQSKPASAPGVPVRYTWRQWWSHQQGSADDESSDENEE